MEWNEFITKNRPIIDEFLGPNHEKYVEIALKGQLVQKIGRNTAFQLFTFWEKENLTIQQKNEEMQKIFNKY